MSKRKTNAERYHDYKERLKVNDEKYSAFKRQKADQSKASRAKKKESMTNEEREKLKVYERERKRKQRAAKSQPMKVKITKGILLFCFKKTEPKS